MEQAEIQNHKSEPQRGLWRIRFAMAVLALVWIACLLAVVLSPDFPKLDDNDLLLTNSVRLSLCLLFPLVACQTILMLRRRLHWISHSLGVVVLVFIGFMFVEFFRGEPRTLSSKDLIFFNLFGPAISGLVGALLSHSVFSKRIRVVGLWLNQTENVVNNIEVERNEKNQFSIRNLLVWTSCDRCSHRPTSQQSVPGSSAGD